MLSGKAIRFMLFGLGFLSIGTQIYLMRQFLVVCNGNEFVIGIVLSLWMLLTGTGAYFGRFLHTLQGKTGFVIFLLILLGILPSLMLVMTNLTMMLIVPYGSMASLWTMIITATLVQMPFCLLNGFLFTLLCVLSSGNSQAGAYSWESLGSMASGAVVNFVLLWIFDSYQSLLLLTACYCLLMLVFIHNFGTRIHFYTGFFFSVSILVVLWFIDFKDFVEKIQFKDQKVISNSETPYGQIVITKSQGQLNFFENGLLLFSEGNDINNEENVHFAMVQRKNPRNVLLISGGFTGTLTEILKYKPEVIDYVEMNPSLIRIASSVTNQLENSCIRVHETDARKFIRTSHLRYDVALINLPSPSTLQLNRYYTLDFLEEIKSRLKPGGIIAYSLPSGSDYVSKEAGKLNAALYSTLGRCFKHVLIIPATRNYFLSSDSPIAIDIPRLINERGIQTVYVNEYYLDLNQLKERSAYVTENILAIPGQGAISTPAQYQRFVAPSKNNHPAKIPLASQSHSPQPGTGKPGITDSTQQDGGVINRDFYPIATFYHNLWWLGYFSVNPMFILMIFGVILFAVLASLNPVSTGLFSGGFTLASTEIILIFGLQVLYGYVFQAIGMIIMIFMMGLAAGAGIGIKLFNTSRWIAYLLLQAGLAVFSIILPAILEMLSLDELNDVVVQVVIGVLSFLAAFLVGAEYRTAALLDSKSRNVSIANNYSADLFGAGLGALCVTLFLFPFFGIIYTGVFLAALNLISAFLLLIRRWKMVSL